MISKHIACKPENDYYRSLAIYVGGGLTENKEKIFARWCAGFNNDEDFKQAISTVAATQAMNTRSGKEKTYHLMVSFRPEDNHKLTLKILRDIESRFAAALGLDNYQRHCGVHHNTGNLHLHVAYNLIHPEKFTRHEPYNDYYKRNNLCRELEKEYGLSVDVGQKDKSLSDRAASLEAFSGKQSFAGYCLERREAILAATLNAANWEHVHQALAQYGIAIKPHGNGLVLQAANNPRLNMKASAFERSFSKSKLETHLGAFKPAIGKYEVKENYQPAPVANTKFFEEYKQSKETRKQAIAALRLQTKTKLGDNKQRWDQKRQEINFMPLTKKDRYLLINDTYRREREEKEKILAEAKGKTHTLKEAFPFNSWPEYRRVYSKREKELMQRELKETQTASAALRHNEARQKNIEPPAKEPDKGISLGM